MYTEFYNLEEKPFNLTPSPRFLYLGDSHKEALALLTYGVVERKGFILLTGEVGTGKTTMVQTLLSNLDSSVRCISISNPLLSRKDFIDYIAFSAFRKKVHFKSKAAFLLEFEELLQRCLQHQENVILIIDEAHKLSYDLLEEIRLLSNMESADEKLINIFLIGQPELNEKLSNPKCRALLQRISSRYHIPPLTQEATREYVENRLKIAGAKSIDDIFSKGVIRSLHHYSGGYPRLINILADNALLLGYSTGKRKISSKIIKQCYDDMNLEGSFSQSSEKTPEASEIGKVDRVHTGSFWKWAAILLFAIVVLGLAASQRIRISQFLTGNYQASGDKATQEQPLVNKEQVVVKKQQIEVKKEEGEEGNDIPAERQMGEKVFSAVPVDQPDMSRQREVSVPVREEVPFKTIIVKRGDTVTLLAVRVYGRVSDALLNLIRQHNPGIKDINMIEIGQKIVFPLSPLSRQSPTFTVYIATFQPFEEAQNLFKELMMAGHEVFILPEYDPEKGKVFAVALGSFNSRLEAEEYAATILEKEISGYAEARQLEVK